MMPHPMRMPEFLRRDCARKLKSIETSNIFRAILGSLLEEDWTTPNIVELRFSTDRRLMGRSAGAARFKAFHCLENGLISNIHRVAAASGLDGDELTYLLAQVARIKVA
jgi:hypothetical protein